MVEALDYGCFGTVIGGLPINAILAEQAGEPDPERAQLGGGQLEGGRGRGLAGHVIGLRRIAATVDWAAGPQTAGA
jgi:hypothetical protein